VHAVQSLYADRFKRFQLKLDLGGSLFRHSCLPAIGYINLGILSVLFLLLNV
jgi:hypothetical protein